MFLTNTLVLAFFRTHFSARLSQTRAPSVLHNNRSACVSLKHTFLRVFTNAPSFAVLTEPKPFVLLLDQHNIGIFKNAETSALFLKRAYHRCFQKRRNSCACYQHRLLRVLQEAHLPSVFLPTPKVSCSYRTLPRVFQKRGRNLVKDHHDLSPQDSHQRRHLIDLIFARSSRAHL